MLQFVQRGNESSLNVVSEYLFEVLKRYPVLHNLPPERGVDREDKRFILTRQQSGRYSAKPNIVHQGLLFTGKAFPGAHVGDRLEYKSKLADSGDYSHANILAQNVKFDEFHLTLESHPLYRLLRDGIDMPFGRFCMENPYGIAMGYGLSTPLIPFSSRLDVACVLASCTYNSETNVYTPVEDGLGIIYALQLPTIFGRIQGLSTVGSYPFCDLDRLKLFALELYRGMDLSQHPLIRGFIFKQNKDCGSSALAKVGQNISPMDELHVLSQQILKREGISQEAFSKNIERNIGDDERQNKDELEAKGFNLNEQIVKFRNLSALDTQWRNWCDNLIFNHPESDEWIEKLKSLPQEPSYINYFKV